MIITRANTDINRIMIHHTDTDPDVYGRDVNNIFIRNQQFGAPFDILINHDGKIDITSRWAFGVRPENYFDDIHVQTIAKRYPKHLLSAAGVNYNSNLHDVHVAVVGNFDNTLPTNFQLNALQQVLEVLQRDIPTITDVLYHDDEANTTCPGRMFFNKSTLSISDGFSKDYLKSDPINLTPEQPFTFSKEQVNEVMGSNINVPIYYPPVESIVSQVPEELSDNSQYIRSIDITEMGQSFLGNGSELSRVRFWLRRRGNPSGFCRAVLYTHTGTFGYNSKPGTVIATSADVSVATIIDTVNFHWYDFYFASGTFLTNIIPFIITFQYNNQEGFEMTMSSIAGAPGNYVHKDNGVWVSYSYWDTIHIVYGLK